MTIRSYPKNRRLFAGHFARDLRMASSLRHDEPTYDTYPRAETIVDYRPIGKSRIVHDALNGRTARVLESVCERHFHPL